MPASKSRSLPVSAMISSGHCSVMTSIEEKSFSGATSPVRCCGLYATVPYGTPSVLQAVRVSNNPATRVIQLRFMRVRFRGFPKKTHFFPREGYARVIN